MSLIESKGQSFVIRIWLEKSGLESEPFHWRGHITHVFSNERIYFEDLDDLAPFISRYIDTMTKKPPPSGE